MTSSCAKTRRISGLTVKLAVLTGLLCAQFAIAQHQHEHEHLTGDDVDVCSVCLQLESGDKVLPKVLQGPIVLRTEHIESSVGVDSSHTSPLSRYSTRAPPFIPTH